MNGREKEDLGNKVTAKRGPGWIDTSLARALRPQPSYLTSARDAKSSSSGATVLSTDDADGGTPLTLPSLALSPSALPLRSETNDSAIRIGGTLCAASMNTADGCCRLRMSIDDARPRGGPREAKNLNAAHHAAFFWLLILRL